MDARYCHSFLPSWRTGTPLIIPVLSIFSSYSPRWVRLRLQGATKKNDFVFGDPVSSLFNQRVLRLLISFDFSPRITQGSLKINERCKLRFGTTQSARNAPNGRYDIGAIVYHHRHYLVTIITDLSLIWLSWSKKQKDFQITIITEMNGGTRGVECDLNESNALP